MEKSRLKNRKKFKGDVLDYRNMKVYKWQSSLGDHKDELDDTLMDETPEEAIRAWILGLVDSTPQQTPPIQLQCTKPG